MTRSRIHNVGGTCPVCGSPAPRYRRTCSRECLSRWRGIQNSRRAAAGPPPEPRTKPSPQMIAAMARFLEVIGLEASRAVAMIDEAERKEQAEREEFVRQYEAARAARKR